MEMQPELPFADRPEQLTLFELEHIVDELFNRTDAAAFTAMNGIVQVIRDRYGPLGDPRSIAEGEDW